MLLSIKILILATIFVVSGGALFFDRFRQNALLISLASLIAILGTFYLGKSIYTDLVEDIRDEIARDNQKASSPQIPETENAQTRLHVPERDPSAPRIAKLPSGTMPGIPHREDKEGEKFMGMYVATNAFNQLVVFDIDEDSEAYQKNMRRGDRIAQVGHKNVSTISEARANAEKQKEDGKSTLLLLVYKGEQPRFVVLPFQN